MTEIRPSVRVNAFPEYPNSDALIPLGCFEFRNVDCPDCRSQRVERLRALTAFGEAIAAVASEACEHEKRLSLSKIEWLEANRTWLERERAYFRSLYLNAILDRETGHG